MEEEDYSVVDSRDWSFLIFQCISVLVSERFAKPTNELGAPSPALSALPSLPSPTSTQFPELSSSNNICLTYLIHKDTPPISFLLLRGRPVLRRVELKSAPSPPQPPD